MLPANVQTIINNSTKDIGEIVAEIQDIIDKGEINVEVLREKAEFLDGKADEYRQMMESDLTEEELADLETRKADAVSKLTAQKKELEKTLDEAEQAAKDYLAALKESRKKQTNKK